MKKYLKIQIPHIIQKDFCQSNESNFIQFLKAVSKIIFVLSGRVMFIKFILFLFINLTQLMSQRIQHN